MKKLYFDCETTGVDPVKNDIIQFSGIIEIDNVEKEKFDIKMKPMSFDNVDIKALSVSGNTMETIKEFDDPEKCYNEIVSLFDKHINKYDKSDKFVVCGYNVKFDIDFLTQFFKKNGNDYLFSYFGVTKDPINIINYLIGMGKIRVDNYKLETMCNYFGVKIENAHDAMEDIKATKLLIDKIDELLDTIDLSKFNVPF